MKRLLFLIWCGLLVSPGLAGAQKKGPMRFTMEVSPKKGTEADTFIVTVLLEVRGIRGVQEYEDPDLSAFELLGAPLQNDSSVTRFDAALGQTIVSTSLRRYRVLPKRKGELRIGPARVRLGGRKYQTKSVRVNVQSSAGTVEAVPQVGVDPTLAGGVGAPGFEAPSPREKRPFFLHAVADKKKAVVGEQVTVTWLLYGRGQVFNYRAQPPRLSGLWSESLYEPTRFQYHDVTLGRTPYLVAVVSKKAVFPTNAGVLAIPPLTASITNTQYGARRMESNALEIDVEPLPDGAPESFSPGYVGDFSVAARTDRRTIDADGALTLTVEVRARAGAIRRTEAPQLSFPGFDVRPPRDPEEAVSTEQDVVGGSRVYEYWLTPKAGGQQTIPPIELSYFDPREGTFKIARSQGIPVMVRGTATGDKQPAMQRGSEIGRGIRLIRDGELDASTAGGLTEAGWFWFFLVLPPFGFLCVLATDHVRRRLRRETPRSRLRRARGRAQKRLRVAEIHLQGQRTQRFYTELTTALFEHIEDKTLGDVRALTRAGLARKLSETGFPDAMSKRIGDVLEASDFARFAPSEQSEQEMRRALEQVRSLLRDIEDLPECRA